jgi:16S rRNA (guanine966-N2)-methyltransferase
MKIVAGKYGGRRLVVPKNEDIRPTSDKVRGAIFNMLTSRGAVDGAHVLDAFCGTGALGLEALSRGAKYCEFIDKSRVSLALARENAEILGESGRVTYTLGDVRQVMKKHKGCESVHKVDKVHCAGVEEEKDIRGIGGGTNKAYSLIFLDPPYNKGLIISTLGALKDAEVMNDYAWIVCESERGLCYDDIEGFHVDCVKEYGSTKVALLQYDDAYSK